MQSLSSHFIDCVDNHSHYSNIEIILSCQFFIWVSLRHRGFFRVQCVSIDFLLRCLLSINDWLTTFVATERAMNVCLGVKFSQTASRHIAKSLIPISTVVIALTFLHDPLHRQLMDEEDEQEQRIWCMSVYSPVMQKVDLVANSFQFLLPFFLNLISTIIIIFFVARMRSKVQQVKPYKEHLTEQLQQHKHLLISPALLVGLAVPRLSISLLSGCMKSGRDSWLYLFGYFVSFTPSIMTFAIFVLPSDLYINQFRRSMRTFCR